MDDKILSSNIEWRIYWEICICFQIGAFFMINLCLVVIATQFSETKKRETERMLQERKRFHSSSTLASLSEPGSCYAELLKYIEKLARRGFRKLVVAWKSRHEGVEATNESKPHTAKNETISMHHRNRKRKSRPKLSVKRPRSLSPNHELWRIYKHRNSFGNYSTSSRQAPRASPELSELDVHSSTDAFPMCAPAIVRSSANSLQFREFLGPHNFDSSFVPQSNDNRRTSGLMWRWDNEESEKPGRLSQGQALIVNGANKKCLSDLVLGRTSMEHIVHPTSSQILCDQRK